MPFEKRMIDIDDLILALEEEIGSLPKFKEDMVNLIEMIYNAQQEWNSGV